MYLLILFSALVFFTGFLHAAPPPPSATQLGSQPMERCYYGPNQESEFKALLPCYINSDSNGIVPCCMKGDNCLEHGACWSPVSKITYQYGCTDSTYQSDMCPKKCGLDTARSRWVGLVYCNGTNHDPDETWLCHHPDTCKKNCPPDDKDKCLKICPQIGSWDYEVGNQLPYIECSQLKKDKVAIEAGSPLNYLLTIPTDPIKFQSYLDAHHSKQTAKSSSTQSTSVASTTTSTSTAPSNSSETDASPSASSTSTTEKKSSPVVLGLSLGLGIPIGIAAIGLLSYFLVRRRRKALEAAKEKSSGELQDNTGGPSTFAYKAELPAAPLDPVELDSETVVQSDAGGYTESPLTSPMVSPLTSEFSGFTGYGGELGPRERWSMTVNSERPVYELEG